MNLKWYAHFEKNLSSLKHAPSKQIPLLNILSREMSPVQIKIYRNVTAASDVIATNWKRPKSPLAANGQVYYGISNAVEHYSAIKRNKLLTHATR